MKKIIFMMILLAGISYASAGITNEQYVPAAILNSFHAKFPEVQKVTWNHCLNGIYEADFFFARKKINAFFDKSGQLIEADMNIKWLDLPYQARNYVYSNFALCHIEGMEIIEKPNKKNFYGISLSENNHLYLLEFNKKGDLIRRRILS